MKVLIFESTRGVIKAEKAVRASDYFCRVIPVPRSISPQCGMALEVRKNEFNEISEVLSKAGISIKALDREGLEL
jgi:hypothetical protein